MCWNTAIIVDTAESLSVNVSNPGGKIVCLAEFWEYEHWEYVTASGKSLEDQAVVEEVCKNSLKVLVGKHSWYEMKKHKPHFILLCEK